MATMRHRIRRHLHMREEPPVIFRVAFSVNAGKSTRDKNTRRKTSLRETYFTDVKKRRETRKLSRREKLSYFIGIILGSTSAYNNPLHLADGIRKEKESRAPEISLP
ncbi:hypothetical protein ACS0PU_004588 [Formica fusca]